MKRMMMALAVALLAVLTIWTLLDGRIPQETEADRPIRTGAREPAPALSVPTAPAALPEGPPADTQTQSSTEEQDASSCAEAARLGIAFAPRAVPDEEICARSLRIFRGQRVPVLPEFAGFEIPDFGDSRPRARLFTERDNPDWSRTMEGRILSESAKVIDFPLLTLHTVCRSSTCGVLFVYTNAAYHGGSYNYYAQQLADALGFSGFHAGSSRRQDGIGFMFVYLGDWSTARPE